MRQVTKEQAIRIFESEKWKDWEPEYQAYFQLNQERMCMPFGVFHAAVEHTLGRSVWTHEFGRAQYLREELVGRIPKRNFNDTIDVLFEMLDEKEKCD